MKIEGRELRERPVRVRAMALLFISTIDHLIRIAIRARLNNCIPSGRRIMNTKKFRSISFCRFPEIYTIPGNFWYLGRTERRRYESI